MNASNYSLIKEVRALEGECTFVSECISIEEM